MSDAITQIGAVTIGGSAIGGATSNLFGDGAHVWVGAAIGALFGLAVSLYDVIRSRRSASPPATSFHTSGEPA